LQVERDSSRRQSASSGDTWTVEAAVDLGGIGALHAKVTLTGKRIGVQLRAESPGVVDALASRAGELESMLRSAGLEIDRVLCLHGVPAAEITTRSRLLDVRA
jgi:Flagellar hook-length control protein FliK